MIFWGSFMAIIATLFLWILMLLASVASAGSFYLNDRVGLTGAFQCDGQIREAVWLNSGGTMRFTAITTWVGVQMKGKGDVWVFVERLSDRAPMSFVSWDHYAEPTGLHQFVEYFNPAFSVGPGDGLAVAYFCQPGVKTAQIILKVQHE